MFSLSGKSVPQFERYRKLPKLRELKGKKHVILSTILPWRRIRPHSYFQQLKFRPLIEELELIWLIETFLIAFVCLPKSDMISENQVEKMKAWSEWLALLHLVYLFLKV